MPPREHRLLVTKDGGDPVEMDVPGATPYEAMQRAVDAGYKVVKHIPPPPAPAIPSEPPQRKRPSIDKRIERAVFWGVFKAHLALTALGIAIAFIYLVIVILDAIAYELA